MILCNALLNANIATLKKNAFILQIRMSIARRINVKLQLEFTIYFGIMTTSLNKKKKKKCL